MQRLRARVHERITAAAEELLPRIAEGRGAAGAPELRALLTERLAAAAQDISGLLEGAAAEYEEKADRSEQEMSRQRKLLRTVLNPEVKLHRAAVLRLSVAERQLQLCLPCGASDVIWTLQDRRVLATRDGSYETNQDTSKYRLQDGGALCVLRLQSADSGRYSCNQRPVAELEVLTGPNLMVSAGRTLLLPCRGSGQAKQRWFHRRKGKKREAILTRFRNGTVREEREDADGRFRLDQDALQILDLQPEDAGEYLCNRELEARVIVLEAQPEETSVQPATFTTATPAVMTTDVVETTNKEKRPENSLVLLAVVGLCVMILLTALLCVLLTSIKCRRMRKYRKAAAAAAAAAERPDDTELQPWSLSSRLTGAEGDSEVFESPCSAVESIHYASLGRHNWRERPSRTPPEPSRHNVIYSSVITRPAAK
ncbi:uncharacterized protein LOC115367380 isoform X2 [Myripristis murdjan]|uniref:uncharacterized protein LOC115367380 isoform X2 n=1 Tax=Myripristis murdjan TaxID=586833 RepID=UPI001175EFA9|nr:uncharacterized protein LOC115367380 isoform X2 [Myripristis murdjan]